MALDEFSARRNSVKRSGKRITVDMKKELDNLIFECFDEDDDSNNTGITPLSDIKETIISTPPITLRNQSPQNNNNATQLTTNNDKKITQEEEEEKQTLKTPRRLQYSNSQTRISHHLRISTDGNGRSSTVETNGIHIQEDKEENRVLVSSEENDSITTTSTTTSSSPSSSPSHSPSPSPSSSFSSISVLSSSTPSSFSSSSLSSSSPTSSTSPAMLSITIPTARTPSPTPSPTFTTSDHAKGRKSLFFDNAASKMTKASIITTNTVHSPQGAYTAYVMEVSSEGGLVVQNVSKRFKNFTELVDKLKDRAPELPGMLPAKIVLSNMAAKLVSQRKVQLQALLDYILNHKDLSRSVEVHAFFRNPTLLAQLASKPDMEGYLQKGFIGALGVKYMPMWVLMKSPCLYFCQSPSETAELKSAVILRWLTVEIVDETTFTFDLRPWQYLLFPSDPQSKPTPIRASSREEMLSWVRTIHRVKASVSDIIMLKKTMLLEEDASTESEIGEDEDERSSEASPRIPPLSLSSDTITRPSPQHEEPSDSQSSPRRAATRPKNNTTWQKPTEPLTNPPSSPSLSDSGHRIRNQTAPSPSQPPKMVARSQTEGQLTLLARPKIDSLSAPPSPVLVRNTTPVSKLKEFVEKPDIPSLSRFEARMALMKEPPKPGKMQAKKPASNPLLLTSHTPTPDTDENILLSATKQQYIRGATANKLFEKVIDHTFTGTEYLDLVSAFLIGYRTFATPTELLDRLIQAYLATASAPATSLRNSTGGEKVETNTTRICICNFMSKWIDFHLHDFLADANLVNKLITFLDSNMQTHVANNERTSIEKIKNTIKKKTRDVVTSSEENQPQSILPALFHSLCGSGNTVPFLVMDFDKTEVARHLCVLEFEAFSKILPTECLNQAWNKKEKETKAVNITAVIKRFNEVSCWVSSMLVTTEELKARTALLTRVIEIADECRQFNNFNSVVAIVSGLESSAVHRLKKTWGGLSPQILEMFEQLKRLMTTEKNYLTYRNVIKLANPPCIPYLGVFLTDLVFIDEAPDVLQPSGLINFDKWYKVAWVVREIRKFQVTKYPFRVVPEVIHTLTQLPVLPENEIYSLSLKCEERAKV